MSPFLAAGIAYSTPGSDPFHLVTIDPAQFHAALVQKEMYPQVSSRAAVYAPLGHDLLEHLKRIILFNTRPENPTVWELEIHAGPGFEKLALSNPRRGIVVLSGRNSNKMGRIAAAIQAGFHVLGDKPWTLASWDIPRLGEVLDLAETNGQVAFDIMSECYEITSIVARELVADGAVFGNPVAGSADQPGVFMESIHHIMKQVAGVASLRPLSFFDIEEQGEGLSDVGTHLVDLVQWTLFPNQAIDYRSQIEMLAAKRWPTLLTPAEFTRVTGVSEIPATLRRWTTLDEAVFRGACSQIEIRQGKQENYRPELYITPATSEDRTVLAQALEFRINEVARPYPGIQVQDSGAGFHVIIPAEHRTKHEMHFAEVTPEFFTCLASPKSLPRWEKPNMLAKYWITTRGVEMSRQENG